VAHNTTLKSYQSEINKLNEEKHKLNDNITELKKLEVIESEKIAKIKEDIEKEIKGLKDNQKREEKELVKKND